MALVQISGRWGGEGLPAETLPIRGQRSECPTAKSPGHESKEGQESQGQWVRILACQVGTWVEGGWIDDVCPAKYPRRNPDEITLSFFFFSCSSLASTDGTAPTYVRFSTFSTKEGHRLHISLRPCVGAFGLFFHFLSSLFSTDRIDVPIAWTVGNVQL